jgi:hypothetical protein
MKLLHFLSGLPRSGSTVLAAILNQHPYIKATSTSGLIDIMGAVCVAWESFPTKGDVSTTEVHRLLRSMVEGKYETELKPVIIDKSRGWANPVIMKTMHQVLGRPPKIIATVRHPADCAASFVRLLNPDNLTVFLNGSEIISHLKSSYATLQEGYEDNPECFLFVDYDELLQSPQAQMNRVLEFLELPPHQFDFNCIDTQVVAERDDVAWGIPNLHSIAPRLGRQHNKTAKDILGYHWDSFHKPRFWMGETQAEIPKKKIDISVGLSKQGQFEESYRVLKEAQGERPECNKIAFNMGWFALREGKLQEGMNLMSRGRYENAFGNPKPDVPTPLWDGKSMGTVLYYLEGGLGDQIHSLKYISDLNRRGCDVIVACSPELCPIVKVCTGVKMIIDHCAAGLVYHDFWIPAMSVLTPLGYEYSDINGKPYIPRTHIPNAPRPVIGVRWQGNPKFEDEQNRRFPLEPFFEALQDIDADFVCLQRDEGEEDCPDFIRKVALNNWEQTREVISGCDLVISSCTSIAHLSGAMGVPTWVVLPVLNYYIWSPEGDSSPFYDSVRLFRQEKFGEWNTTIEKLDNELVTTYGRRQANEENTNRKQLCG